MAVAFRSAGTIGTNGGTTSMTIPYPSGIAANDLLILQLACGNTASPTTPSGWTRLFTPVTFAGTTSAVGTVYWKIAAGTETGNLTFSFGNSAFAAAVITAYTGCDTTTPVDVFATATLPTSGTTGTTPSVTTTKAQTMLLRMYWNYSGSATITPAGTDTERYDVFNSSQGGLELATSIQTAAGASGTTTATYSTGTSGGLGATVAIAPVAASSPPVADFTGTPTSGNVSLSVTFTDASSNTPTSWAWDFGDGGTSSSQNPSHSYTTSGIYTVVLIATNAAGSNTKTRTAYVTVGETIVYAAGGGVEIY